MDDTILCSAYHHPAGVDGRYPKGLIYPGCLKLYQVLDEGIASSVIERACNIVFLSARPHLFKNFLEYHSYQKFKRLVHEGMLHAFPTLLPGALIPSALGAVLHICLRNNSWRFAGRIKYKTFREFRDLYREYDFIFSGDDGQGDLLAGQLMVADSMLEEEEEDIAKEGCRVLAVLIHHVLHPEYQPCCSFEDSRERIFFHDTYVGVSVDLHNSYPHLVTAEQLVSIASSATEQFESACGLYPEWPEEAREIAEEQLRRDLERAGVIIRKAGLKVPAPLKSIEQLDLPPFSDTSSDPELDEDTSFEDGTDCE